MNTFFFHHPKLTLEFWVQTIMDIKPDLDPNLEFDLNLEHELELNLPYDNDLEEWIWVDGNDIYSPRVSPLVGASSISADKSRPRYLINELLSSGIPD